ncbi:hypothetical protein KY289_014547 [Solanum tuberosum]|nr:hypothetical protein KY289_014547 [Solanum tuberosum]
MYKVSRSIQRELHTCEKEGSRNLFGINQQKLHFTYTSTQYYANGSLTYRGTTNAASTLFFKRNCFSRIPKKSGRCLGSFLPIK